jgi:hypothetical protein
MGHAAGDILPVHSAVKADGRIEIVCDLFCRAVGSACPHFRHFTFSSNNTAWEGVALPALMNFLLAVNHSLNLDGQTKEVDEAGCVSLIVIALAKGCDPSGIDISRS